MISNKQLLNTREAEGCAMLVCSTLAKLFYFFIANPVESSLTHILWFHNLKGKMSACLGITIFYPVKWPIQEEPRICHTLAPVTPFFPDSLSLPKCVSHINRILKKREPGNMLKLQQNTSSHGLLFPSELANHSSVSPNCRLPICGTSILYAFRELEALHINNSNLFLLETTPDVEHWLTAFFRNL